jgi:hypothetical protein
LYSSDSTSAILVPHEFEGGKKPQTFTTLVKRHNLANPHVKANQAGRSTSCLILFWASNSSRAPSFAFWLGPSIIFLLIFARYSQLALLLVSNPSRPTHPRLKRKMHQRKHHTNGVKLLHARSCLSQGMITHHP